MRPTSFGKVDFVLALSGHLIFADNRWQRILHYLLLLMCWVRVIVSASSDLFDYTTADKFTLFHVSDSLFWIFCVTFHVIMMRKRRQVATFVCATIRHMRSSDIHRLERQATLTLLYFMVYWITQNLIQPCIESPFTLCEWKAHHILYPRSQAVQSLLIAVLAHVAFAHEAIISISWMATALVVYHYARSLKNAAIVNKLKHLWKLVSCPRTRQNDIEFEIISSITQIQDSFDQTFSLIPFLVFSSNFFQTSGYFLFMLYNESGIGRRITMILLTMSYIVVPIILCIAPASEDKARRAGNAVIHCLQMQPMSQKDARLVKLVERLIRRKESGWLFEFDRTTILSFAGHMTSFAVIFLQLMPPSSTSSP